MKLPWSNVQIDFKEVLSKHFSLLTLHKKWNFPLRIFSVNVIKSELIVQKLVYRNLIYFLQQLCVSGLRYRHCEYILVKFSEPLYGWKRYWMSLPAYVFSGAYLRPCEMSMILGKVLKKPLILALGSYNQSLSIFSANHM